MEGYDRTAPRSPDIPEPRPARIGGPGPRAARRPAAPARGAWPVGWAAGREAVPGPLDLAWGWARDLAARFGLGGSPWEPYVTRLATCRTAAEVRTALAEAAAGAAGGARVGFEPDPSGSAAGLLVPLRFAGRRLGLLRVVPRRPRPWPRALARRLEALAAMAAAAELALGAALDALDEVEPRASGAGLVRDPATGLHSASFLDAYLAQALALSRRRREPLALIVIEPDGLEAVRDRDGPEFADSALDLAGRAVTGTLRSSDLVARLDRDRLAAVLPGAARPDAHRLAGLLGDAIAEAGIASATDPPLTATLGVAGFPDDASDAASLRLAAVEALALARSESLAAGRGVAAGS